jgi:hypothetical protein
MMSVVISAVITSRAWCWPTKKIAGSSSSAFTLSEIFIAQTGRPFTVVPSEIFFASAG